MEHKHDENCYSSYGGYREYLIHAAPSFLWADVQDVGDYQGRVYGIAWVNGKLGLYEDYYGSCSGCGAWGEGGEPSSEEEIVARTKFFATPAEALAYIDKEWNDSYAQPDSTKIKNALDEIAYRFLDGKDRDIIKAFQFTKEKENVG